MSDADTFEEPTPSELKRIEECRAYLAQWGLDKGIPQHPGGALKYTGDPDFDEILQKCREILGVKGEDYTIGSKDRLANFRRCSENFGISPMQSLGIYFYKHVAAVFNFMKSGGQSESEPIEGRIADCINYMLLFYKMVKEQKGLALEGRGDEEIPF